MSTDGQDRSERAADETPDPIADEIHDTDWSANLEHPRYADDVDLTVRDALDAITRTDSGNYVNLVTHGELGHPEEFLFPVLDGDGTGERPDRDTDLDIRWEYVDRCGCGGHVTRVHVHE